MLSTRFCNPSQPPSTAFRSFVQAFIKTNACFPTITLQCFNTTFLTFSPCSFASSFLLFLLFSHLASFHGVGISEELQPAPCLCSPYLSILYGPQPLPCLLLEDISYFPPSILELPFYPHILHLAVGLQPIPGSHPGCIESICSAWCVSCLSLQWWSGDRRCHKACHVCYSARCQLVALIHSKLQAEQQSFVFGIACFFPVCHFHHLLVCFSQHGLHLDFQLLLATYLLLSSWPEWSSTASVIFS